MSALNGYEYYFSLALSSWMGDVIDRFTTQYGKIKFKFGNIELRQTPFDFRIKKYIYYNKLMVKFIVPLKMTKITVYKTKWYVILFRNPLKFL